MGDHPVVGNFRPIVLRPVTTIEIARKSLCRSLLGQLGLEIVENLLLEVLFKHITYVERRAQRQAHHLQGGRHLLVLIQFNVRPLRKLSQSFKQN